MRWAVDKNNKRIFIDNASFKEDYFCPICQSKLVQKKGNIVIHHFAHYPNCKCSDNFHYEEKTLWHISWQNLFPIDSQEVVITKNNEKHIADIFLSEEKTVIEFQHSNITPFDFEARNLFYTSLGYKVFWVFDKREEYSSSLIKESLKNKNIMHYISPSKCFKMFAYHKNSDVKVFFQISGDEEINTACLHEIKWVSPDRGIEYYSYNERDKDDFLAIIYNRELPYKIVKDSLIDLYIRNNCKVMIVLNTDTDDEYLISRNPLDQDKKYHQVYGRKKDSFGDFEKENSSILNYNKSNWKLVWKK